LDRVGWGAVVSLVVHYLRSFCELSR
jgi:hypothetical protein